MSDSTMVVIVQQTEAPINPETYKPTGFLVMRVKHHECGTYLRMRIGANIIGLLTGKVSDAKLAAKCPVCNIIFAIDFRLEEYNDPNYQDNIHPEPPIDNITLLKETILEKYVK